MAKPIPVRNPVTKPFRHDRPHKRGSELTAHQRASALAQYVHRYTRTHRPRWAERLRSDGTAYPVQFDSDADWLANTLFNILKNGDLANRDCFCTPTWPDNPELRRS